MGSADIACGSVYFIPSFTARTRTVLIVLASPTFVFWDNRSEKYYICWNKLGQIFWICLLEIATELREGYAMYWWWWFIVEYWEIHESNSNPNRLNWFIESVRLWQSVFSLRLQPIQNIFFSTYMQLEIFDMKILCCYVNPLCNNFFLMWRIFNIWFFLFSFNI